MIFIVRKLIEKIKNKSLNLANFLIEKFILKT